MAIVVPPVCSGLWIAIRLDGSRGLVACLAALFIGAAVMAASAADIEEARELYRQGEYERCAQMTRQAIADDQYGEEWRHLAIRSLMATGKAAEATELVRVSQQRYATSVKLAWLAYEVFDESGRAAEAAAMLGRLNDLGSSYPLEYRDAEDLTALGKAALALGIDPRTALEVFFEPAKKRQPRFIDAYLAAAEVAIGKNDFALAARQCQAALKHDDQRADIHWMMARAFTGGDRERAEESLDAALSINHHHAPSHLLRAEHRIDAELYDKAENSLASILKTNPDHPEAWALRAVLAHLRSDEAGEKAAIESALKMNSKNPRVFHLTGRKLSQKYRFAEGAAYQRRALEAEPDYLPAKIQLATDLLRLGQDPEGWKLAEEVHQADAYNVLAYNLATLREHIGGFAVLKQGVFTVKMDRREAAIYGKQVLDLLTHAADTLTQKYGLELRGPIIVEIFPDQRDFAVRTFGLPGGVGYLGVCFGNVITANSPASQTGGRNNWQAVLWHEFCHVVTLNLTRNKMPRWLSEGISVHEEMARSPTWGQAMNPKYRALILEGELQPISRMSSAFMGGNDVDFAYFQSSLVVRFLVESFGLDKLRAILRDLGEGAAINDALARHTTPIDDLEKRFEQYARALAESMAPQADFADPELDAADESAIVDYLKDHPTSFHALSRLAQLRVRQERWAEAEAPLLKLKELWPDDAGQDNPYQMLATVYRQLEQPDDELKALREWAERSSDAVGAYGRLMELGAKAGDWQGVMSNAERYMAVNPLAAQPYEAIAQAAERLNRPAEAVEAWSRLLLLEPADPALVHYRLASLLQTSDPPAARRHVLAALEEAPRYRDALALLLRLKPAEESR